MIRELDLTWMDRSARIIARWDAMTPRQREAAWRHLSEANRVELLKLTFNATEIRRQPRRHAHVFAGRWSGTA